LDDLEARVAAIRSRLDPQNPATAGQAHSARARAERTHAEASAAPPDAAVAAFEPSPDLKALYRDAAKRLHPDLGTDEHSRDHRTRLMAEVNAAYAAGNEEALRRIVETWEIARVKTRIADIMAEIAALEAGDLCALYRLRREADADGRNLLQEMALSVEGHIAARRRELVEWQVREAAA
jgi:hypothetical protein